MTAKGVRVRVSGAKQRDAGRGWARINDDTMHALNIVTGDTISIKGKRTTAAVVWPAYQEDQVRDIIRIDGLVRKNAGASINEYVVVEKADVKDASFVTLAPVDLRLNVDRDFTDFVKSRLLEFPMVQGDRVFVAIRGTAVPFSVVETKPKGIVKMGVKTNLQVRGEPELSTERMVSREGRRRRTAEERRAWGERMLEELRLYRFSWLKDVEGKYASEHTKFYVPDGVESECEDPVLNEAKKKAEETNQPVQTFVDLWAKRGKIASIPWSLVKPDGTIEYNYTMLRVDRARPKSFDRIVVHNKDGTTREVTRFDELVLLFLELETQQKRIEAITDERLELSIEKIQNLMKRRRELRPQSFRGWHGLARTLGLEKNLWLLIEERERRAKEK
jgi:hypothetical protein